MSKGVLESRKMYQSPFLFLAIIPIGAVILLFLFDFVYKVYIENKANRDMKNIFITTLDKEGLENNNDLEEYFKKKLIEYGYENYDIDFHITDKEELKEEGKFLVVYFHYYSVINQIFNNGAKVATIRYKAHYDEHKKTVVEVYDEDEDDLILKEDTTTTKQSLIREN